MGALSDVQITELVEKRKLVIEPFERELVQPASYDLRLGPKVLASPLGPGELGATIELNKKTPSYRIQTGQMVAVISMETLELPLNISARFGIRSEYARRGVIAFGGVQIDPGFRGRVIMNLQNVGPEPVTITMNEPLFTVEFQRLEKPALSGYSGKYQDQDDFPEDQYDFILSARTTSLAEIPTLRQEVARLNVLIEQLEEWLPDPDEGFELRPEVQQKLFKYLETPRESLVTPDKAWKKYEI
ncbi:MAG: dCTP deaminase [Dehalococcoidia bacterium]